MLLCDGDETKELAEWVLREKLDPNRIVFYLHQAAKPKRVLSAWIDADLTVHATWTIKTWTDLHKHFGAAWHVQVFDDFRRKPP